MDGQGQRSARAVLCVGMVCNADFARFKILRYGPSDGPTNDQQTRSCRIVGIRANRQGELPDDESHNERKNTHREIQTDRQTDLKILN